MSNPTPPGWYDDGQGGQRWWDGARWAPPGQGPGHPAHPPPSQPPPTPAYGAPAPYAPQADYAGYGGAPGGYGAPAPKKRTGLILGIVGGAVLLGVVALVLVLVLGGGDAASSDDPAETVESFLDSSRDGDCDAAAELVTGQAAELLAAEDCEGQAGEAEALGFDPDDVSFDVGEADVDGDRATVPVTTTFDGDLPDGLPEEAREQSTDYELVREDGSWLIEGFGFDLPSGDLPTADVPTDALPTDIPTEGLPSDFGSELPTDFPSDFLSDLPSEFLSDFPSEFLSELPSGFPTE